jgi:hypothetical protein
MSALPSVCLLVLFQEIIVRSTGDQTDLVLDSVVDFLEVVSPNAENERICFQK